LILARVLGVDIRRVLVDARCRGVALRLDHVASWVVGAVCFGVENTSSGSNLPCGWLDAFAAAQEAVPVHPPLLTLSEILLSSTVVPRVIDGVLLVRAVCQHERAVGENFTIFSKKHVLIRHLFLFVSRR